MKKFIVNIWAYDHHAKFEVDSEDNPQSLENAILDKLGENSIKWEDLGVSYDDKTNRITYEEVIDCLLYTSPSPRDAHESRMPSSA